VAIFSKFFGRTVGEGAGVAIGTATANVVEPALQELANAAKEQYPHYPLEAEDAAAARAREPVGDIPGLPLGGVDPSHEALYSGMQQGRFDVLTELQREHPSVGELLDLRRRNMALGDGHGIGQQEFQEWLRRTGFSAQIIDALTKLLTHYLAPADVANAVQQGFVPDDGLLPPADLSGPPFDIPTEQVPIDPKNEAAVSGLDANRLKVLAELSGNPPGPMELNEMRNRGLIDKDQWLHGIREGRTKTKWAGPLYAIRKQILSGSQAARLRLKGWITPQESYDIGALSGYDQQQMERLYLEMGRPAAPQQMQTAWARGVDGPDGRPMDQAQFQKGIQESDIRPEWGPMLWGIRYAYPPLFQLNRLVLAGAVPADTAATWATYQRYHPDVIAALKAYWQQAPTAKGDPHVVKAENQLWTTTHRSFIAFESNVTQARAALRLLNVPAAAQDQIMLYWQAERDLIRRQLTPAQVKKAYAKPVRNPATGTNWTRQDALDALVERGYTLNDANTFLDE
jgi:hypothetical protein